MDGEDAGTISDPGLLMEVGCCVVPTRLVLRQRRLLLVILPCPTALKLSASTHSLLVRIRQIMEAREEVEQTSDHAALHAMLDKCRQKQSGLFSKLNTCFEKGDTQTAKDLATELIYEDRLEESIKEKLPTAA